MTTSVSGPLFDGRALLAVDQWVNSAVAETGRRAEEIEGEIAEGSFKNPTGHHQSQVDVKRPSMTTAEVSAHGVIYGPWLETGKRRGQQTRFKGYFLWRRTKQRLEGEAVEIFFDALRRYIGKMG